VTNMNPLDQNTCLPSSPVPVWSSRLSIPGRNTQLRPSLPHPRTLVPLPSTSMFPQSKEGPLTICYSGRILLPLTLPCRFLTNRV